TRRTTSVFAHIARVKRRRAETFRGSFTARARAAQECTGPAAACATTSAAGASAPRPSTNAGSACERITPFHEFSRTRRRRLRRRCSSAAALTTQWRRSPRTTEARTADLRTPAWMQAVCREERELTVGAKGEAAAVLGQAVARLPAA